MLTISKRIFDEKVCCHRKIHIYKNYYLVSIYAKCSYDGKFHFNLHNILLYPLPFVYRLVKVVPNKEIEKMC